VAHWMVVVSVAVACFWLAVNYRQAAISVDWSAVAVITNEYALGIDRRST
jgi:hypothetical protein